jgi:hypothetical protein
MSRSGESMEPRRLRAGEWVAAAGGVALLASLFIPWYRVRLAGEALSGWEAFTFADILLALAGACGLGLALITATQRGLALPVGASVVTVVVGAAGVLAVAFRLLDAPGPDARVELQAGGLLALLGALAVTVGAWLALRDESPRIEADPADPELRPAPPREAGPGP